MKDKEVGDVKIYRKLVIGGIGSKILVLILLTGVLISLAFLVVTGYQSRMLTTLKTETSARQQESISEITDAVMDQVVQENIARITQMHANETDEISTGPPGNSASPAPSPSMDPAGNCWRWSAAICS